MRTWILPGVHGFSAGVAATADARWVTWLAVAVCVGSFIWHSANEFSRGWDAAHQRSINAITAWLDERKRADR